eukprot:TRINITY_DN2827_c0_g1_i4.p1 TRINITY_DN2827_c0_g1~~TRINITY_DN2827_c0_g1_i4.p1  ORF type:complete len:993 (-),score=165.67 TRINITY_DN2827_c0_g1_i4:38-2887(-)
MNSNEEAERLCCTFSDKCKSLFIVARKISSLLRDINNTDINQDQHPSDNNPPLVSIHHHLANAIGLVAVISHTLEKEVCRLISSLDIVPMIFSVLPTEVPNSTPSNSPTSPTPMQWLERFSLYALAILAFGENHRTVLRFGAAKLAVTLIQQDQHVPSAVRILRNLSKHTQAQGELLQLGVLSVLQKLAMGSHDILTCSRTVDTVANLTEGSFSLLQGYESLLRVIVSWLYHPSPRVQESVLEALQDWITDERFRKDYLSQYDIVNQVSVLLRNEEFDVREDALWLLTYLTYKGAVHPSRIASDLPVIIKFFFGGSKAEVYNNALITIYNFVAEFMDEAVECLLSKIPEDIPPETEPSSEPSAPLSPVPVPRLEAPPLSPSSPVLDGPAQEQPAPDYTIPPTSISFTYMSKVLECTSSTYVNVKNSAAMIAEHLLSIEKIRTRMLANHPLCSSLMDAALTLIASVYTHTPKCKCKLRNSSSDTEIEQDDLDELEAAIRYGFNILEFIVADKEDVASTFVAEDGITVMQTMLVSTMNVAQHPEDWSATMVGIYQSSLDRTIHTLSKLIIREGLSLLPLLLHTNLFETIGKIRSLCSGNRAEDTPGMGLSPNTYFTLVDSLMDNHDRLMDLLRSPTDKPVNETIQCNALYVLLVHCSRAQVLRSPRMIDLLFDMLDRPVFHFMACDAIQQAVLLSRVFRNDPVTPTKPNTTTPNTLSPSTSPSPEPKQEQPMTWSPYKTVQQIKSPQRSRDATKKPSLKLALESDRFSDVNFMFPGGDYNEADEASPSMILKGHRAILQCKSSVFAGMFSAGLRESLGAQVDIVIRDCSYKTFRRMLQFLYLDEVDLSEATTEELVELISITEQYQVEDLKVIAAKSLTKQLGEQQLEPEELLMLLDLPHQYDLGLLVPWVLDKVLVDMHRYTCLQDPASSTDLTFSLKDRLYEIVMDIPD